MSLRILFISAFYPPHVVGGWEQLVADVNQRLQMRGHRTKVLTSMYGVEQPQHEPDVARLLHLESAIDYYRLVQTLHQSQRAASNEQITRQTIEQFQPDVIFVHVMWNLTHAIPFAAEQMLPNRVVYYIANDWPYATDPHTAYWRDAGQRPIARQLKRLIAPLPLRTIARTQRKYRLKFNNVLCVSEAVRQQLHANAAIPLGNMQVVYNGVDTERFVPVASPSDRPLKLIYAGSLVEHKGVHTILEALTILREQDCLGQLHLTIVGGGHPAYEQRLKAFSAENKLTEYVTFFGRIPRTDMPKALGDHDVLLLPSIWEEPLARVMQEGMAAGLAVIGTLTGGSGELLHVEETGLTFDKGNATQLAACIERLDNDRRLLQRLAHNGRAAVESAFSLDRMIDQTEAALLATVQTEAIV